VTCSCEFSGWLRQWLSSFGAGMPWVALAVLLLWWARKGLRRECFDGRMSARRALGHNAPAAALFVLATVIILLTLWRAMP